MLTAGMLHKFIKVGDYMAIRVIKGNIRVKGTIYKPGEIISIGLPQNEAAQLILEGYAEYIEESEKNKSENAINQDINVNINFNPNEVIKPKKVRK